MAEKVKKKRVILSFEADSGCDVFVAGSFNNWELQDKKKTKKMKEDKDQKGLYTITLMLPEGDHEYKFFFNGAWHLDPNAEVNMQNVFGTFNSVIKVQA
jgi:1,4-alpha-glucan branching enzyme